MNKLIQIENAEKSLSVLHAFFSQQDIKTQAEVLLPSTITYNSAQHYCYLFYSCLLNYGMKSSLLHSSLRAFYDLYPEMFSPKYIVNEFKTNNNNLAVLLKTYVHVRYPNECAKRWISLSISLHNNYHDNPKEMFTDLSTYEQFKDAVMKVKGFGQKTGGLLLRILIDNRMVLPIDGIAEIPIDRHDIDLSVWLKVIVDYTAEEIKKNSKLIKLLSDTWVQAANNIQISPSLADQYLWIIGSEYCTTMTCQSCPLYNLCFRARINND